MKSFFFCRISTYGIFSLFWRPFIQPSNWHWSTFHHSYSEEWRSTNENPIQFHGCGPISFIGRGSSSQLYFDAFNQIWGQKIPWIHSGSSIFCFTDFFNRSGIFFSIKSNILCFLCCLKPFFREMHFRTKHIFVLLKVGQLESILKSRSCVMQTMKDVTDTDKVICKVICIHGYKIEGARIYYFLALRSIEIAF